MKVLFRNVAIVIAALSMTVASCVFSRPLFDIPGPVKTSEDADMPDNTLGGF